MNGTIPRNSPSNPDRHVATIITRYFKGLRAEN